MSDKDEFGFEETKSAILDYFLLVKETKWIVGTTIGVSILILLLIVGIGTILIQEVERAQDLGETTIDHSLTLLLIGSGFIASLVIWLPLSNGRLIFHIIFKGRKQERELIEIQNNLIRRSYLMNFELVEPEIIIQDGDPRLEKIMNHLSYVFPDISRINKKRIKKNKSVEKHIKRYRRKMHFLRNYDLPIKTSLGWYVVQFFPNLMTFDDIEKITKKFSLEKTIGTPIQRVIVIGKEFDESFEEKHLEKKMISLQRKIRVDILTEDELGYSVNWID